MVDRLNEVMKVLTITIMMPLLDSPAGFWAILGVMGTLALAMLNAFRRAGWI